MEWEVEFHDDFLPEFEVLDEEVQDVLFARILLLQKLGFNLGRPYVDTLKGTKFKNLKELRFETNHGVWRVAFAFDPERKAVLLVAGNKLGENKDRFYRDLINTAEIRLTSHIRSLRNKKL